MFDSFARHRIDTGEVTINCVVGGSGPPVLLLHGYPQCLAMWARTAPVLAEKYTVVCADLRGYGDSSKPKCLPDKSNYSFRAMAADQVAAMKQLGFAQFHVIGHDRGGRTAHRMALDHPDAVRSLAVLDIVPTHKLVTQPKREVVGAYWHWQFLALPAPFPETLIGADPDYFYGTAMSGFGNMSLDNFDAKMMAEYRRCWRDPAMIQGSCSDYRAAAIIDVEHDSADLGQKIACPTLVCWGEKGPMARYYDIAAEWRERCADVRTASLPGSHFFIDQFPRETAEILMRHLGA
ncbi:MAG TPA: alpha/beta hydrolase [Stellaceae bacterium]